MPVQVLERRLRLRRDPAIEALLRSLGAKVVAIEAPFEPEGGAYEARPAALIMITAIDHDHDHDHHHDHGHDHHDDHHHHHDHKHDPARADERAQG